MLKSRSRCWMLLALVTILSLSVTWTVRAATEQAATIPATSTPVTTPAVTPAYYSPSGIAGRTTPFHDGVAAKYNYAFGKDAPFLPSNATSSNGQFLDPKSFPTAEYCGHCHKEAYHQWRQSVHANAFREPWYLKNVDMLIDEKGVQFSRHCEGCHNPVALFSGSLSQGMPKKRPFEDEGVTCSTCHGRVDQMPIVYQAQSLQMEWCLNCHRNPAKNLRPTSQIYNMAWEEPAPERPVWCAVSGEKIGVPTAQSANCTTKDPTGAGPQMAFMQKPTLEQEKTATDASTGTIPASLHYEKFTSQDQLGHFLLKQYHIRNPYELSSCEVCHR